MRRIIREKNTDIKISTVSCSDLFILAETVAITFHPDFVGRKVGM